MAQTAANLAAGSPLASGGISVAPKGTALPTDATTALNVAFKALGYCTDSGLEPTGDAAQRSDVKMWGGDVGLSVVTDKATKKFKFTLAEVYNGDVAKFVFGSANVTVTPAASGVGTKLAILDKAETPDNQALVFELKYQGKRARFCIPDGAITVTEVAMTDGDPMGYECEVTCLPDSSGVRVYRYFQNDDAL